MKVKVFNFKTRFNSLLGLAWLWKAWQDTAPGAKPQPQRAQSRPQQQQQQQVSSVDEGFDDFDSSQTSVDSADGIDWRGGGLGGNTNAGTSQSYPGQQVNSFQVYVGSTP